MMIRGVPQFLGTSAMLLQCIALLGGRLPDAIADDRNLCPAALAASADGRVLYVACAAARQVAVVDVSTKKTLRTISVPESPSGLALASDRKTLYVTCAAAESTICVVDTVSGRISNQFTAGHTAMAPVLSPDGKTLFVCCRFDNCVDAIDLIEKKVIKHVPVAREPVAAAISPDGKFLLVANHIQAGRSDVEVVGSGVSVIDVASGKVCREIALPNGSTLLRDVRISPDGRYAVVTHTVARFHLPTTQVDRGWINNSAASLIDLAGLKLINTVLLDNIDSGAANPWAAAWSADGQTLCITHAGTHELSVIKFPALLAKLAKLPALSDPNAPVDYLAASRTAADVPNDLSFLVGVRERIRLGEKDRGPRALVVIGSTAWLANYFSDSLSAIHLEAVRPCSESIPLGPARNMTAVRRGELLFNDATICFQGWQSCASCHSSDARVDGMNWDNLNDGIGNPKNAKSLLHAHRTPPSMWLGVRSNACIAVRAGIRNSLFTVQPPEVAEAIDEYLKSLEPIPSPYLVQGKLSPAAERGKALFFSESVGCAECHQGALYTDKKRHDVGTVGKFDQGADRFDTPSLIEVWRTAPYLHDGSALTIRDVLTTCNPQNRHGNVSPLTREQLEELAAYVLSL